MDAYIEFESWLLQQPLWLQEAAYLIIKLGDIPVQEEKRLMELCLHEAACEDIKINHFESGVIVKQGSLKRVSIRRISNIVGVNAIKQTRALDFDIEGINVVYGDNGSGKTGYIRLLKKISQSRFSDAILQNIYEEKTACDQSCDIEIQYDAENQIMHMDLNAIDSSNNHLQNIAIFDTRAGERYLKESLSATYEPWIFSFIEKLVIVCDHIKILIDDYDSKLEFPEIKVPQDLFDTSIQEYITQLNTKSKPLECKIADIESHLNQIKVLESELADSFDIQQIVDSHMEFDEDSARSICDVYEAAEELRQMLEEDIHQRIEDELKLLPLSIQAIIVSGGWRITFINSELQDVIRAVLEPSIDDYKDHTPSPDAMMDEIDYMFQR